MVCVVGRVLRPGVVFGGFALVFQLPTPAVSWVVAHSVLYSGFNANFALAPNGVCKTSLEAYSGDYSKNFCAQWSAAPPRLAQCCGFASAFTAIEAMEAVAVVLNAAFLTLVILSVLRRKDLRHVIVVRLASYLAAVSVLLNLLSLAVFALSNSFHPSTWTFGATSSKTTWAFAGLRWTGIGTERWAGRSRNGRQRSSPHFPPCRVHFNEKSIAVESDPRNGDVCCVLPVVKL